MRKLAALAALPLLLFLGACHSGNPNRQLLMRLDPPQLKSGQMVVVTAMPNPKAELAWVSGTVDVMGAGDVAFTLDPRDGAWRFKTMIPAFVSIPSGNYEAKAWGETRAGERFDGSLKIEVK